MTAYKPNSFMNYGRAAIYLRPLFIAAIAIWALLVTAWLLAVELHTPSSFDGAMNLEISHSLAHGEGYRRMYAPRHLFPHEIQTNAPYILPAAAVFRLFGVGIAQTELVNVVYFLALAVLACFILRAARAGAASTLGVAAIVAVPGLFYFGFTGYGEIPALTWFLAATATYFWPRTSYENEPRLALAFYAGILLALAYLTKTVMLIGFPVFGGLVLVDVFLGRRRSMRQGIIEIGALAGGVILPIAVFEAWKLASLGGVGPWLDWWRTEFGNVLWQAGVSKAPEAGAGGLAHKVLHHLNLLSGFYHFPRWVVGIWLIVVFGTALVAFARTLRNPRYLIVSVMLGTAAVYLVWWLALTPDIRAWLRRIMNGMLLANLGVLAFAWTSTGEAPKSTLASRAKILLLLAFPAMTFCQQSLAIASRRNPDVANLLSKARMVRELPQDAYLFGIGWDSAPNIALFSGRLITNFNQLPVSRMEPSRPAYVVKQPPAEANEPINHAFSMYGLTVPRSLGYGVYQIPSFTPKAMVFDPATVTDIITDNQEYPYKWGAYEAVPGFGFWLASDNLFVLRGAASQSFKVTGYAPPLDKYLYAEPLHATASFNGCRAPPKQVPNDQIFTIHFDIPADCDQPSDGIWYVRIEVDNVIDLSNPQGDHRSLAVVAKEIGFVDTE